MKHLRNQIFICEKDYNVGDNTFKVGQWYASAGACNDHISIILDGKFIPVHSTDLLTNFKLVNSAQALRYFMATLEAIQRETHAQEEPNAYVLDSLVDIAKLSMNTYKTVAI